jgi:hypothetical protein
MVQYLEVLTQGFWSFIGVSTLTVVVLLILLSSINKGWNRFWRHWNIRKQGYPTRTL